MISFR